MKSTRRRCLPLAAFPPLCAVLALGGCATVFSSTRPTLSIRTDSVVATVLDSAGRTLGTTPFRSALPALRRQDFVLVAPGYDTAVVSVGRRPRLERFLNLVIPIGWMVDLATGAVWEHDPSALVMTMQRTVPASDSLPDAVTALAFSAFADVAEREGCEPLLVGAWRDAARLFATSADSSTAVPDSVRRMVAEEAESVAPEVRRLCARPSARIDQLRRIREGLGRPAAPDASALLFAPVYFEAGAWEIADDSVRARLRALAATLSAEGTPVTLLVEGFSDAQGSAGLNRELGFQRALAVIRELRRGGLPPDCCVAASHGADPERQAVPGASGSMPGARLNRRVTFSIDYRTP